jgi:hypothetical protein
MTSCDCSVYVAEMLLYVTTEIGIKMVNNMACDHNFNKDENNNLNV